MVGKDSSKGKRKYLSKRVSRRKQLRIAREAKGRAPKTATCSEEKESEHQLPTVQQEDQGESGNGSGSSGLGQPILEESPPKKKSRSEEKLCKSTPVSRKSKSAAATRDEYTDGKPEGFALIDVEILDVVFSQSAVCKVCKQGTLCLKERKKEGVARKLSLSCDSCGFTKNFATSKKCTEDSTNRGTPGPKVYEANYRFVLGMRIIGKGLSGMNMFCGILNMPHAMKQSCYESIMEKLETASKHVANSSMKVAAQEVNPSPDAIVDTKCMFDGTWQKRGFSSLIGGVSCISADTGKVIDVEILRKSCKGCQSINKLDVDSQKSENLKALHNCSKNYEGSSPSMEVVGVRRMFNRSIAEKKLRYTHYIGDGDSKTYETVSKEKPYGEDIHISKLECVGHVQKRVGNNLRKLKAGCGNQKLADGKTIGGKGRLTNKEIDQLQVYYGLAIRRNIGNVEKMKESIDAILRHRVSTDEMHNHTLCPKGKESWCAFQRNLAASSKPFHHKNPLPKAVALKIKPLFDRLSSRDLLQRCVDGYTQNAAESFHSVLWHLCPKETYVGSVPINSCASLATILYNDGYIK